MNVAAVAVAQSSGPARRTGRLPRHPLVDLPHQARTLPLFVGRCGLKSAALGVQLAHPGTRAAHGVSNGIASLPPVAIVPHEPLRIGQPAPDGGSRVPAGAGASGRSDAEHGAPSRCWSHRNSLKSCASARQVNTGGAHSACGIALGSADGRQADRARRPAGTRHVRRRSRLGSDRRLIRSANADLTPVHRVRGRHAAHRASASASTSSRSVLRSVCSDCPSSWSSSSLRCRRSSSRNSACG